jgi:hypothetical protein
MSDTLTNKEMDAAVDAAEADTQRVISEQLRRPVAASSTAPTMTEAQMHARIKVLSAEMDANDEKNRVMQAEIDTLYAQIDAIK